MYCSQCGAHCPEGARFCHLCGTKLYFALEDIPLPKPPAESTAPQSVPEEPMPPLPEETELPSSPELSTADPFDQTPLEAQAEQLLAEDLPEDAFTVVPQAFQTVNASGKRSVRVALLVLLALLLFGTLCYVLLPNPVNSVQSMTDAQANWLSITADGALSFQPQQYYDSQLTIPDSVAGFPVTALSNGCFADATDLVWIQLPTTLKPLVPKLFPTVPR